MKSLTFKVAVIITGLLTIACHSVAKTSEAETADWQKVDAPFVSLRLPQEFKEEKVTTIDTFVRRFAAPDAVFQITSDVYLSDFESMRTNLQKYANYQERSTYLDGNQGYLYSYSYSDESIENKEWAVHGLHLVDAPKPNRILVVFASAHNDSKKLADKILGTIRIDTKTN